MPYTALIIVFPAFNQKMYGFPQSLYIIYFKLQAFVHIDGDQALINMADRPLLLQELQLKQDFPDVSADADAPVLDLLRCVCLIVI